jgi:hypothetical protein
MMLCINNFYFITASTANLIAPRIGFPYQATQQVKPGADGAHEAVLESGTEKIEYPLVRYPTVPDGTQFYQPIMLKPISGDFDAVKAVYDTEYVRHRCLDYDKGSGLIFQAKDEAVVTYPAAESRDWLPPQHSTADGLVVSLSYMTMDWIERIYRDYAPTLEQLSSEDRSQTERDRAKAIEGHQMLVRIQVESDLRRES